MKKHHIHDHFMKEWLSDTEEARAFFEAFLPAELTHHLQLATLQPLSTSYVGADLTSKFSDLIWRVQTTHGSIQICLLLEHKSYRDPHVVFQVLGYLAEGYLNQVKNQKTLELIVPMVYYHGKKKWKLSLLSDFFADVPPEWRRYIPAYDLIFHDLQKIPRRQIEQLQHGMLQAAVLIQRDYAHPERLKENLQQILLSLEPYLDKSGRESIFVYLVQHLQITYEEFIEIQKVIPIKNQEHMKSLYDQLIERGIERGKEQGIELGIERGKEQGIELGIERGKEQGIELGIERGIEKSILNAFDHHIDLETIQVITGESLEKIKDVLAKHGRLPVG